MDSLSLPFILFWVASPKQWTAWVYLLSCFKWLVLNNGQLKFTFCLCFKWLVINNGQLEFTFCLVSSGQSQTTNILCLPVILSSVIPSMSGQEVSPLNYHFKPIHGTQSFSPVKLHYPLAESDPFLNEFGYPVVVSWSSQNFFAFCIHNCITSIHSILGQKWCTLYLSFFDLSNQRFLLQISGRRNLNRGICHTPIFDLRYHWHVPCGLNNLWLFKQNFGRKVF